MDNVPVDLLRGDGRDIHLSYLLLRASILAREVRDPRTCVDYEPSLNEQLPKTAAIAVFSALRGESRLQMGIC